MGLHQGRSPYKVLRDTREKENHGWVFPVGSHCVGTHEKTLKTGDYTLEGFEDTFVIERKGSVAEFSTNLTQPRFEKELERLDQFKFAFIVLEFELKDIVKFPVNSGIPEFRWATLRVTPQFLMKRLHEVQLAHRAQLVFAGMWGREYASSLFKRVVENAAKRP